jgi:hypothetical protein
MVWLKVTNPHLESLRYPDCGMAEDTEVQNGKVQVSEVVAEQLLDHPSGDFAPTDSESED